MSATTASLRDALLAALATLPGTREFHLHVLISSPRKHTDLFRYAHPRPRVYLQGVFVLLSEKPNSDSPRQLVSAVELSVYNIPSTSCGIVYVSKVDSTGQGMFPSPTATLVKALLRYYADPATRPIHVDTLWIQLFARAQNQYLFPNSSEYAGKRPLSDRKLCAWWKRILGEVAAGMEVQDAKLRLFYVLPGYNELEALNSLHTATSGHAQVQWTYGHQYSQNDIPLPCPLAQGAHNLGHYIPSFEDDPKSRFMDEIAYITEADGVKSPERKRARTLSKTASKDSVTTSDVQEKPSKEHKPPGELSKVSTDEFWERMSFRQECVAGAVTGFFALVIATPSKPGSAAPSPLAPQPGQVASDLVKRVIVDLVNGHEFPNPERAAKATETFEEAIRRLCEGIPSIPPSEAAKSPPIRAPLLLQRDSTPESSSATLDVPRTPPRKRGGQDLPEVSPNPFPEPIVTLETYESHIYGSVSVANAPLPPRPAAAANGAAAAQPVTVLTARKKKRKAE